MLAVVAQVDFARGPTGTLANMHARASLSNQRHVRDSSEMGGPNLPCRENFTAELFEIPSRSPICRAVMAGTSIPSVDRQKRARRMRPLRACRREGGTLVLPHNRCALPAGGLSQNDKSPEAPHNTIGKERQREAGTKHKGNQHSGAGGLSQNDKSPEAPHNTQKEIAKAAGTSVGQVASAHARGQRSAIGAELKRGPFG